MAEQSTFIKLDRNILRWRWWGNGKILHVFLFLLLNANVEDHELGNDLIRRGEVVTSLSSIGKSTGLTCSQIRHTISTLKKTGEITSRYTNRYQVITIVNYDRYQEKRQSKRQPNEQTSSSQVAVKQHRYKNIKNDKNDKNINIPPKSPTGGLHPSGYPYPCGLYEKPEWMTDEEWEQSRLLTADDIPGIYRGYYDSVIEYLHDKKEGRLP